MILNYPINNCSAIDKYKHRKVLIYHSINECWMSKDGWTGNKNIAMEFTLEDALIRVEHYKAESLIKFQFVNEISNCEKPNIKEFDVEDVYNCPTVTFENADSKKHKNVREW